MQFYDCVSVNFSLTLQLTMTIRISFITLLAVCVFAGCGKVPRPEGFPDLFPCEITITQEGQPLDEAVVRLVPEGNFRWGITGKTNASGVAKIFTHAQYAGAPAGTFKVCVSKRYDTPTQFPAPAQDAPYEEWAAWREKCESEERPSFQLVQPKYDDVTQTPHSITITKGTNRQTFDLGEPVTIPVE